MATIFGLPSALSHSIQPPVPSEGEGYKASAFELKAPPGMVFKEVGLLGNGCIATKAIPHLTTSLDVLLTLSIDPLTLHVIALIDGNTPVGTILREAEGSQSEVLGILFDLSEAKLIHLTEPIARCA